MKKWFLVLAAITSLTMLLSACGSPAPTSTATAKPTATASSTPTATATQTAEDFYKNNAVTLVINGSVGGGTDYAGRVFASYWGETIGGPAMMTLVKPGMGGIEGTVYTQGAKPDGLTIGITTHSSEIGIPYVMGQSGIKFDPRTLSYVGMFGDTPHIIEMRPDAPWKTVADLQAAPKLKWGSSDPTASATTEGVLAIDLLGLSKNSTVILGYPESEKGLNLKRGEIDLAAVSAQNYLEDKGKGFVKGFAFLERNPSPWDKDVPPISQVVKLTPDQDKWLDFAIALGTGKVIFGPAGVPADRLAFMRASFEKLMKNEGFLKNIKLRYPIWSPTETGQQVADLENSIIGTPKDSLAHLDGLLKQLGIGNK
jgi:tripartite-type tricarboxylate transporter receptor subunit TctC